MEEEAVKALTGESQLDLSVVNSMLILIGDVLNRSLSSAMLDTSLMIKGKAISQQRSSKNGRRRSRRCKEMIIVCIGDSLTEGDHGIKGVRGIANVSARNYPWYLSQMTGAEVRNYGRCGWRATDMFDWYQTGAVHVQDAEIILIMLGTNGGQSMDDDTPDNAAYIKLVECVKRDAPGAKVYLCTSPHVTVNPEYSNCGYAPQVAQAVGFVRKYGAESDTPVIDLAASKRITEENEAVLQGNDGLHFTDEGYRVLAEEILDALSLR